jgi:hypothetical protein
LIAVIGTREEIGFDKAGDFEIEKKQEGTHTLCLEKEESKHNLLK